MENNSYFILGTVLKIDQGTDKTNYVTFKTIESSQKNLKDLKTPSLTVKGVKLKIGQKVLIVFNLKTDDILNYFIIK